jgi:acetyl-CoA acetyltransferase family protein
MEVVMQKVVIVAGKRTPFAKATKELRDFGVVDLVQHAVDGLLSSVALEPAAVEELHAGSVVLDPRIPHMAREVVFRSQLPATTRAVSYVDNCITGTTAIIALHDAIALGRIEVGIAGGGESMSNTPILVSEAASDILRDANAARSLPARLKEFSRLRIRDLAPSLPGVEEPSTGLSMGQHTELMVKEWGIGQAEPDEIAYRSHMRAHAATKAGHLIEEIEPLAGLDRDAMVRPDTTMEKLAKLRPVFDRENGTLTAGNSSPLTDGAAVVLMMSEERAAKEGLEPLAYVEAFANVGIDPEDGLLMGPAVAVPRLLASAGLSLEDVELVEMHEAFGGQVACNLAAWREGWKEPAIGEVDPERLNVNGSSISIGHPFAGTGARIALTLANEMARRDAKTGLISICAAGAQAAAMLLTRP